MSGASARGPLPDPSTAHAVASVPTVALTKLVEAVAELVVAFLAFAIHPVLGILKVGHRAFERLHLGEFLGHLVELLLAHPEGLGRLLGVALGHRLLGLGELIGQLLDLFEVLGLIVQLGHFLVELLLGETAVLLGLFELFLALLEVGELLKLLAHLADLLFEGFLFLLGHLAAGELFLDLVQLLGGLVEIPLGEGLGEVVGGGRYWPCP